MTIADSSADGINGNSDDMDKCVIIMSQAVQQAYSLWAQGYCSKDYAMKLVVYGTIDGVKNNTRNVNGINAVVYVTAKQAVQGLNTSQAKSCYSQALDNVLN